MTQYNPTPYPGQPQVSGYAQADPYAAYGGGGGLKRCRAAAVAQMVMGAVICLLAFCMLGVGALVVSNALPAEAQTELSEITTQFGEGVGALFLLTGVCMGLPGLGQIILGFFVWRGSKVGLILSMVLCGLFGAFMLLNLATALAAGRAGNIGGLCVGVFMLAMIGGLFALLVMAYREASAVKAARAAYEAQWQQYYQQQYQYQLALQQQAANAQQPPAPPPAPPAPLAPPAPAQPETPPADQLGGETPPSPPGT